MQHEAESEAGTTALLIIDMVNPLDFDGGESLRKHASRAALCLAGLKQALRRQGIITIYANDNFTDWEHDFRELVKRCREQEASASLIMPILPEEGDLFVLKPMHSGFFHSPLQILLEQRGIDHVILAGVAGDGCVLATALDAHMRKLRVTVARDAVASITAERNDAALDLMRGAIGADVRTCDQVAQRVRA